MDLVKKVQDANEVFNLLEHVGWVEVIRPKLLKRKEQFATMLVNHLLGQKLPLDLTKEQVAGKIYGIDYIIEEMEFILKQGDKALRNLREEEGLSLV